MNASSSTRKMKHVIGRILVGLLLILLLTLIIIYALRNTILRTSASALLTPYGIHLDDVQGLKLSTSNLSIQSARFHMEGTDADNELRDFSVTFSLKDLMKGRVNHIQLDSLKIAAISTQNQEEKASQPIPGNDIDLDKIVATLQSIPVDSIIIERLEILPLSAVLSLSLDTTSREIIIAAASDMAAITARVNWHDTNFVSSYFIPDEELAQHDLSGQALTGSLQILDHQALATRFEFTLSDAGDRLLLDAAGEMQLESLMRLLYRYELLEDTGQNLAGAMHFSASLQETAASGSEQVLNTAISLRQNSFISGTIPTFPNDPRATFQWHAIQPISVVGTYQPSSSALSLSVSAQQIAASLHTQTGDQQATLDIAELTLQCASSTECSGHQETSIHLPALTINAFQVQNIDAVTSADLTYASGNFSIHLEQGSRIGADSVSGPELSLFEANILVQQNLSLTLDNEDGLAIASDGVEIHLPILKTGSNTSQGIFKLSQLEIEKPSADSEFQGTMLLEARDLSSDLLPFILRKPEINSMLTLTGQSINATGALKVTDRDLLSFRGDHNFGTRTGKGRVSIPVLQFGEGQNSLSHLFFSFPYEADVIHGTIEANADLQWRIDENDVIQVSGPVHIDTQELSGFFEETALLNFTTTLDGQVSDTVNFISAPELHLEIGSFDPGLPIEKIKLDYSVNTHAQTAEIRNVSARLFDGTIQSAGLSYDWQAPENLFDVEITRIDLSKVLSMGAYEAIKATGFISGHLPVRLSGSNVSVNGGNLHVEHPGGTIRYHSGTTNSGNPALDLVNQALSNYQYGVLSADVSYLPNGDLDLGVTLQGRNPDMNQGQRINLNLNVSDNIPALLESLQASRNITDALERELQNR